MCQHMTVVPSTQRSHNVDGVVAILVQRGVVCLMQLRCDSGWCAATLLPALSTAMVLLGSHSSVAWQSLPF